MSDNGSSIKHSAPEERKAAESMTREELIHTVEELRVECDELFDETMDLGDEIELLKEEVRNLNILISDLEKVRQDY